MNPRRLSSLLAAALICTSSVALLGAVPAGATTVVHNQVVAPVPKTGTPAVDDGIVVAFAQVGSVTLAGGSFTSVAGVPRRGLLAMNADSGALLTGFDAGLDGDVEALAPGPVPNTVYVGGAFNTVAGVKAKGVVLLDVNTGARITTFKSPPMNGIVNALQLVGTQLYLGGTFTSLGGFARGGLGSISSTTGAVNGFLQNLVATNHSWTPTNGGQKAAVGVTDLEVTPDGTKMAIIGNFKTVDGLARDQVAVLNLTGAQSVVQPDWRVRGYEPACYYWAYDSYVRDLDVSPDGAWFAISSTGGGNTTLCDTVSRFEFSAVGEDIQPTWKSVAGGDSMLSVAIAGAVVYAGGHQRWMNNNNGNDRAGSGAVPRPGLVGLDARTGMAIAWNPGRNPRGSGAWGAYVTSAGLWIGSDTDWIGDYDYRRQKIAFFPLEGGAPLTADAPKSLPGGVYSASSASGSEVFSRRDFTGTSASAPVPLTSPMSASVVRGTVLIGDQLFYGRSDSKLYRRDFDGQTFAAERLVDPYNDPKWSTVDTGSGQTFRGALPSFYAELPNVTSMFYENGRLYYTLFGQTGLYYRLFSPDSGIVAANRSQVPAVVMPDITGAFLASGTLYSVSRSTGNLSAVAFTGGVPTGASTIVSGPTKDGIDWRSRILFFGPGTPANVLPTAMATGSCSALDCTFDASSSSDPDGSIVSYAWDFADGSTGTGVNASHTYTSAGTYPVGLTVTDNQGGTATTSLTVTAAPLPATPVEFRAKAFVNKVSAVPAVVIPATVQAGDELLLIATSSTATSQAVPAGWTVRATTTSSGVLTTVWERTATSGDAGSSVTVTLDTSTKVDVHLLAYANAGPLTTVQTAVAGSGVTHTAPSANVATPGSWVIRYWADKSSTTTSWTLPAGVTARDIVYGTGTGFISTAIGDSGTGAATGPSGTAVATTNAASPRDVTATIILPPLG